MPTPTFQPPQGQQSTAQLQDWIIKLVRDLNYILENLDTVNINRLDAKILIAGTITAGKIAADSITATEIAANAITANEIQAGAVTAGKISVSQLSAISADMGTLTAGQIFGAYIATANGSYPRIEFSSSGNLLNAYFDSNHYMSIIPNLAGTPALRFTLPSGTAGYLAVGSAVSLISNIELDIQSTANVAISAGGTLTAISSSGTITDIVSEINSKVAHGSTGSTSVSDGHNHGFTTSDFIQCYDAVGTPTVKKQWVPYAGSASHSHTI